MTTGRLRVGGGGGQSEILEGALLVEQAVPSGSDEPMKSFLIRVLSGTGCVISETSTGQVPECLATFQSWTPLLDGDET